jgi:hypothetical protein
LQFTFRTTPVGKDIPIASLQRKDVLSDDVVQTIDFSGHLSNNTMAVAKNLSTYPYGSAGASQNLEYCLLAESNFEKTILTNETHYDPETGTTRPLWYAHYLRETYYNPDGILKSIRREIRENYESTDKVISAIIPASGNYVILGDSLSIKRTRATVETYLDSWEFYVDYAKGEVTIHDDVVQADDIFLIRYTLIPTDTLIETVDDVPYRVELWEIVEDYGDYYTAAILTPTKDPVRIKYKAAMSDGSVEETEEYTTPVPLFNQVINSVREDIITRITSGERLDIASRRIYTLEEQEDGSDRICTTVSNSDTKFTFTSSSQYSSRIRLVRPESLGFTIDWFPRVTTGRVYTHDGRDFTCGNLSDPSPVMSVTETARVIDPYTLSVSKGNILAMYDYEGGWYGVDVTDEDGNTLAVESLDTLNGLVTLRNQVSRRDSLTVSYQAYTVGPTVNDVCLNPLTSHLYHNEDIKRSIILFILGENAYSSGELPIYTRTLEKYANARLVYYTYDDIDNLLNSSTKSIRNTYRSSIDGLPSEYLGDTLIRLEPLALMYVINPLDEDGYLVEDARLFGGGTEDRNRSFYDHSYYDGEGTDMESYIRVHIPQYMYDDIKARALMWDPDVIVADNPESIAHQKTMALIRSKVKKFSQLGTVQEIIVG